MRVWFVCDAGPVVSQQLLRVARRISAGRPRLITPSLSSYLFARARRVDAYWADIWGSRRRSGSGSGAVAACARAEWARARLFLTSPDSINEAVLRLGWHVDRAWSQHQPDLVLTWGNGAFTRLVVERALDSATPVVTLEYGPVNATVLVDRLLPAGSLLQVAPLPVRSGPAACDSDWRQPPRDRASLGVRALAHAGRWLDYGEKLGAALLGRTTLLPPAYWWAAAAHAGRSLLIARETDRDPVASGFVLVALHSPGGADPWQVAGVVLDAVPADRQVVIRPHPGERDLGPPADLVEQISRRGNAVLVRDEPTSALVRRAAAFVTLSSATGIQALAAGLPTFALENAVYTRAGLARALAGGEELASALRDPNRYRPDPEAVAGFLELARGRHLVPGCLNDLTQEASGAVADRLLLLARMSATEWK